MLNSSIRSRAVISSATLSLLIGCGGGGTTPDGGAVGGGASPPATTSYTAVGNADSVNVVLSGGAVTGFSTVNLSNSASQGATLLDSNNSITKFNMANVAGSASFDTSAGDTIVTKTLAAGVNMVGAESSSATALFVDMTESGFGVYMASPNSTSGFGAATYYGYPNAVTSFTPTGTASYTGGSVGLYGEVGFVPVLTTANMTAAANFNTDTISFSTTGTKAFNASTGADLGSYANLDINASNLADPDGDNIFIGNISDPSGLTGSAEIALFGSSAQEATGIGSLTNNNAAPTKVHLIAFGSN